MLEGYACNACGGSGQRADRQRVGGRKEEGRGQTDSGWGEEVSQTDSGWRRGQIDSGWGADRQQADGGGDANSGRGGGI